MGIIERKLREKEQRIQEILQATRHLFMSKGFMNTTMLDIAEESELSRRTLYLYFNSKEELSYRVMREAYILLFEKLKQATEKVEGRAIDKLEAVKVAYMDFYTKNFDQLLFTLLFDYKINKNDVNDTEAKECFAVIQSIFEELISIFEQGQKDGSLLPQENVKRTALTYMTMIQATMQNTAVRKDWLRSIHKLTGKEVIDEMFSILLHAIRA